MFDVSARDGCAAKRGADLAMIRVLVLNAADIVGTAQGGHLGAPGTARKRAGHLGVEGLCGGEDMR